MRNHMNPDDAARSIAMLLDDRAGQPDVAPPDPSGRSSTRWLTAGAAGTIGLLIGLLASCSGGDDGILASATQPSEQAAGHNVTAPPDPTHDGSAAVDQDDPVSEDDRSGRLPLGSRFVPYAGMRTPVNPAPGTLGGDPSGSGDGDELDGPDDGGRPDGSPADASPDRAGIPIPPGHSSLDPDSDRSPPGGSGGDGSPEGEPSGGLTADGDDGDDDGDDNDGSPDEADDPADTDGDGGSASGGTFAADGSADGGAAGGDDPADVDTDAAPSWFERAAAFAAAAFGGNNNDHDASSATGDDDDSDGHPNDHLLGAPEEPVGEPVAQGTLPFTR